MQTTLRIQDELYREAKATAAREGVTLTRFIESALELKLAKSQPPAMGKPHFFTVYDPGTPMTHSVEELIQIANEDFENYEIAKLQATMNPPR